MTSTPKHVPYHWDEIEDQVRAAILCQLSLLQCLGPHSPELGKLYLGIDPDLLNEVYTEGGAAEHADRTSIPLERHHLHTLARHAYNYAYQLDGWERASSEDHYEIECAVLAGFPQTDMHAEPSPLSIYHDFPLRRVLETFRARWNLYNPDYGLGLSVRELALLTNMTVPAVRTSLSKEGIKLDLTRTGPGGSRRDDDRSAMLSFEEALPWLSGRRGFVPNRAEKPMQSPISTAALFDRTDIAFDVALRTAIAMLDIQTDELAGAIGASQEWVETLAGGGVPEIDIAVLRRLAKQLSSDEPGFVATAVRHLVSLELSRAKADPG
jgi:hypothetical protein